MHNAPELGVGFGFTEHTQYSHMFSKLCSANFNRRTDNILLMLRDQDAPPIYWSLYQLQQDW